MWKNFKSLSTNLLQCNKYFVEQQRTTFILKRRNNARLTRLKDYFPKKLKRLEFYYDLVEDTESKKKPELNLVLLKDVPGVGMMGEKIKAKFYGGYFDLLLPKLAVYENSPEAQCIVRKDTDKKFSSIYTNSVKNFFLEKPLPVFLSLETEWTLQPWHIRVALRQIGIITQDKCIELPAKKISGPNKDLENKDFIVQVTMNNTEKFPVRCRIYHWSKVGLQNTSLANTKLINSESEPVFDEDIEEVKQLMKSEEEFKKRKELMGSLLAKNI